MKYCPYCGASLVGGAASFCPECGKAVQGRAQGTRSVRRRRPPDRRGERSEQKKPHRPKNPMDESYDGYYNDVQPIDANRVGKKSDPDLVKRIVCVVAGAIGIIGVTVILMFAL